MRPERIASLLASSSELDFNIDTGSQIELHQSSDSLRSRIDNIQKAPVRPDLELLTALLVHMRRTVHCELLNTCGQRYGPTDLRASALGRVHDLFRRHIENAMIEGFESDADVLTL